MVNFFQDDTFCVTCKSLNSNHLTLFGVVYFATLKSAKVLIDSRIRVARPVRGCKRLRGYVLTRFLRFRTFALGNVKNRLTWEQKKLEQLASREIV